MNASQLLKHFDRLAEAPDAVARLRRFILDLAVRGKLVEQDAGDEPAVELLKKIRAEQARLVKLGKIKKANALEPLAAGDEPFDLPRNWTWCWLGDIGDWGSGSTPPRGNNEYYGDDITWLKSGELGDSLALTGSSERVTHLALNKCSFRLNQPGDVLIAMYGATIGKLAILAEEAVTNQAVCGCTPFKGILNRYLFLFLQSRRADFHAQSEGGAQPNISKVKILTSAFALPPLAEQHRIVAKVDELMALCDQLEAVQQERERRRDRLAAASLQRLNQPAADATPEEQREHARFHLNHLPRLITRPEQIKAMRQLIRRVAIGGRLTTRQMSDESVALLLKSVCNERKQREKEGLSRKAKPELLIQEDEKLFSLPAHWAWARLATLVLLLGDGLHGTPRYTEGTSYHFINGNNLNDGKIVIKSHTKTVSFDEWQQLKKPMSSNAVLVSINGTLGNVAFYNQEQVVLGKSACYFNLADCIDKRFIKLVIESQYFIDYAIRSATGTTINNLSLKAMNELPVPLPPLAEQHRIVAKVDELMALCDQLEAQLNTIQTNNSSLLEAVLDAALAPA